MIGKKQLLVLVDCEKGSRERRKEERWVRERSMEPAAAKNGPFSGIARLLIVQKSNWAQDSRQYYKGVANVHCAHRHYRSHFY